LSGKRIASVVLLLLLILPISTIISSGLNVYDVYWETPGYTAYPGQTAPLKVILINSDFYIGQISAVLELDNVPISAVDGSKEAIGLTPRNVTPGRAFQVTFMLKVDEEAQDGIYNVNMKVEYTYYRHRGQASGRGRDEFVLPVRIGLSQGVLTVSYYSKPGRPGDTAAVIVTIENRGNLPVYSLRISAYPVTSYADVDLSQLMGVESEESGPPIGLYGGQSFYYEMLEPGKFVSFPLLFHIAETAIPGSYPVHISVNYLGERGDQVKEIYKAYVIVLAPYEKPSKIPAPKAYLSVVNIDLNPNPAFTGETVNLSITLANDGSTDALNTYLNLMIVPEEEQQQETVEVMPGVSIPTTTTSETTTIESPFVPYESSNRIYIGRVGAGSTVKACFTLVVKPDAEPNVYVLPLKLEYADPMGNKYEEMHYIGVYVVRRSMVKVYDIETTPEPLAIGEAGEISGTVANIGLSDVKAVSVSILQGQPVIALTPTYVGDISAGQAGDFVLPVSVGPVEPGLYNITIIVSYVDSLGVKHEEKMSIPVRVSTSESTGGEGEGGFKFSANLVIAVSALVIAMLLILSFLKGRESVRTPHYEPKMDISSLEGEK